MKKRATAPTNRPAKRSASPKRLKAAPRRRKPARKANATKRRKPRVKRNPATAAAMYEMFRGKPSTGVREEVIAYEIPVDLAECGFLQLLKVLSNDGREEITIRNFGKCTVGTTADGGQLYFTNGKQTQDLRVFKVEKSLPKDHVKLGSCRRIEYDSTKVFHSFEPTLYWHLFGEKSGVYPDLMYDVHAERIYLTGGNYQVRREGIVD